MPQWLKPKLKNEKILFFSTNMKEFQIIVLLTKKIEDMSITFLKVKQRKINSLFQADGVGNS